MPSINISELSKRVSAIHGLIGAVPGLAVMIYGLGIPPDREILFRGFTIAVVFATIVGTISYRPQINSMRAAQKLKWASVALTISGIAIVIFINFFSYSVVSDPVVFQGVTEDVNLYLPLFPTGDLSTIIDQIGRDNLVSDGRLIEDNIQRFASENQLRYLFTDIVLLLLYMLCLVPFSAVMTSAAMSLLD
jgi:hypothetical protein